MPKRDPILEAAYEAYCARKYNSIRATAAAYDICHVRLSRRVRIGHAPPPRPPTHNLLLNEAQDEALELQIRRLIRWNFPPRLDTIRALANGLLRQAFDHDANPMKEPPTVGQNWPARWVARHPEFIAKKAPAVENQRVVQEDKQVIQQWYYNYCEVLRDYGIQESDIYNMDESGFQIGFLGDQYVVCFTDDKHPRISSPQNRENVTDIECICADGWAADPTIILKGKLITTNYAMVLPDNYSLGVSTSGWTNNQIGQYWLEDFDRQTYNRRMGTYRLLIFDGHGSHLTVEFLTYCEVKNIVPMCLPPHMTHKMQPLDVGCFQPLKYWHSRAVDEAARSLDPDFSKVEFLSQLHAIRTKAFTKTTIKNSFAKTGLWPYNPGVVLDQIPDTHLQRVQTPPNSDRIPGPQLETTPKTIPQYRKLQVQVTQDLASLSPHKKERIRKLTKAGSTAIVALQTCQESLETLNDSIKLRTKRKSTRRFHAQQGGVVRVQWAKDIHGQKLEASLLIIEKREARKQLLAEKAANQLSKEFVSSSDMEASEDEINEGSSTSGDEDIGS